MKRYLLSVFFSSITFSVIALVFLSIKTVQAQTANNYLYLNGNVGIGTTVPGVALEVVGEMKTSRTLATDVGGTLDIGRGAYIWKLIGNQVNGGDLEIQNPVGTPVMYFPQTGGNVGIGTTNPGSKLQVSVASQGVDGISLNGADNHSILLGPSRGQGGSNGLVQAGDGAIIFSNGSIDTGNMVIGPWSSGYAGLRITSNGNVGIGITSPAGKLNVAGGVISTAPPGCSPCNNFSLTSDFGSLPGYPGNTYPTLKTDFPNIYFSAGGAYSAYMGAGGGWTPVSSKLLKENFTDLNLSNVLDKIDNLPVMKWNYKSEGLSTKHIGPFAEDFYSLFGLNGTDNTHIDYTDSIGVSLAGVKAVSAEVKDLQKQNADLEERVKILEDKVDSLSNK